MTIKPGDRLPDATLATMTPAGPKPVKTADLFGQGTTALFAVPGAFTPTCSARHLPGFKDKHDELKAKGVDSRAAAWTGSDWTAGGSTDAAEVAQAARAIRDTPMRAARQAILDTEDSRRWTGTA